MKGLICIICLLCTIVSANGFSPRIFGGSSAPHGKYPYHVHINAKRGMQLYCGGSIIAKRWILTAAHCFEHENIRKILVQVGSVKLSGEGATYYRVVKHIIHERYARLQPTHDIALLLVDRDIEFNDKVQPVELAKRDSIIDENDIGTITGFGEIDETHTRADRLQAIHLKMYDSHACRMLVPPIAAMQICTLPNEGGGPCIGDSGGPLVDENGIQVGIDSLSFGKCGEAPEIYTRVASFRDWIDYKMMQHSYN